VAGKKYEKNSCHESLSALTFIQMPITPRQKSDLKRLLKQFDGNFKKSINAAFAENNFTDLMEEVILILNTQSTTSHTNATKTKVKTKKPSE
jgi:hypothetical protein